MTCLPYVLAVAAALGQIAGPGAAIHDLPRLVPGRTAAQNALWIENPLSARFNSSKRVVVAEIEGPATITMIHFAMPQALELDRDLLLRAYWDGETSPSVDCPLVDFFCDPAGLRDAVNTALVNKRRGFNAYFPMPFRKSARIELVYDGPVEPGEELWRIMPCYSYVMYRTAEEIPEDVGYFHAHWRQEGVLLGQRDYLALDAEGKGKFVGWNVTVRRPGRSSYPVDENEKFYIDGEQTPSIEFQGIEDSFGFSWGYPQTENLFPLTGYFPFLQGGCGYRFFLNDAISFERSLRVTIGFGEHEHEMFRRQFGKPGNTLQLSSTVYWYQTEPHKVFDPMPPASKRVPAPEEPFWPDEEVLPTVEELKERGVRFLMWCGRPDREVIYAEPGFAAEAKTGYTWDGWALPVYFCRAADETLQIELTVPPGRAGLLRLYVIDADDFEEGRRQELRVGGRSLGIIEDFQEGRWLQRLITRKESAEGKILIEARNARSGSNVVISIIEWVDPK